MPYNEITNRIEQTDKHGISLFDIAKGLRDYRVNTKGERDLGILATSPNIDIWSKNKPFVAYNTNPYQEMTEEDRRNAAYGFYWWNYVLEPDAPFANSAEACLDKAISNQGKWAYKRPTDNFRVLDFDGYLRTAEPPYRVDINSPDLGQNNSVRVVHDKYNPNIEIVLSNMPDFSGDYAGSCADMNIVYLWRMRGTTVLNMHFTGLKVSDIDDQTDSGMNPVNINMGQLGNYTRKEYDFCVAATTADSAEENGAWVFLPDSVKVIVFKEGVAWTYSEVFNGETFNGFLINSISEDYNSNDVEDIAFGFRIKNEFNYAIDYRIRILMWNEGIGESINDAWTIYFESEQIAKGAAIVKDLSIVIPPDVNGPYTATGLKIAVDFEFKNVANTEYISRHMNLLTERFEAYEAEDGYTLAQIRDSRPYYGTPINL